MRKRITAFALALLSALLLMCPITQTASASSGDYIAANHTKSNGKPYYIMVNRAQSTVTIYGLDSNGYYTVPVKAMICSTGRTGHATPLGTWSIGGRWTWIHMLDNSYGQYCTQISGNILFHSVCYNKKDPSTLITSEYNGLGAPASLGCVRLQTIDAKWIYENCARGTKVTVYDGTSPGPLGKPTRLVDTITDAQANGWDPTDPRENNPWHAILASGSTTSSTANASGTASTGTASTSTGTAIITKPEPLPAEEQVSYSLMAQSLYELTGGSKLTHPSEMITWAIQYRLLDDMVTSGFSPSSPITRQEMATMLYRYETVYCKRTARNLGSLTPYTDWVSIKLYARDPMRWAIGNKLIAATADKALQPGAYASRTQLEAALRQYKTLH